MRKPRIFLSHSSSKEARAGDLAWDVLWRIHDHLERDFEVLLDRDRLEGGDQWRTDIEDMMWRCHAAVALLSERALASPHVKKEVGNLHWRKRVDQDFLLIPVLVSPVSRDKLKEDVFAAINITEIQMLDADDPELFIKLDKLLQPIKRLHDVSSPLDRYERLLATILKRCRLDTVDELLLAEVVEATGLDPDTWKPRDVMILDLARHFLKCEFGTSMSALERLARLVPPSEAALIHSLLSPMWVRSEAAMYIPVIAFRAESARVFGLTATKAASGKMYVRRANLDDPGWSCISAGQLMEQSAAHNEEWLVASIKNQLSRATGALDLDFSESELLDAAREDTSRSPIFVIWPSAADRDADRGLFGRIQAAFPFLTFVLLVDIGSTETESELEWEILKPHITTEDEETALTSYRLAYRVIQQRLNPASA